jgi:tetratricopeptide (TPR) repeat protein
MSRHNLGLGRPPIVYTLEDSDYAHHKSGAFGMKSLTQAIGGILLCSLGAFARAEETPPAKSTPTRSTPEINAARRYGWDLATTVVGGLKGAAPGEFPGIAAWLEDYDKVAAGVDVKTEPEAWPALDFDALLTNNPKFWRAYYEIAPGDHGLTLLRAGLLLAAGEAVRATHDLSVGWQRPGMPKEVDNGFVLAIAHANKMREKPNAIVAEGIKLHDAGDYAGAIAKYEESLALWPQNGFAFYEVGYLKYFQELAAAGKELPKAGAVILDGANAPSAEVAAIYAISRRHDPFQINAYSGADKEAIAALLVLVRKAMPVWSRMMANVKKQVSDKDLANLAAACQEAGIHDLALTLRGGLVARRGRYAPEDHPFIAGSLSKLAPGEPTEDALKKLAGPVAKVLPLVTPEAAAP